MVTRKTDRSAARSNGRELDALAWLSDIVAAAESGRWPTVDNIANLKLECAIADEELAQHPERRIPAGTLDDKADWLTGIAVENGRLPSWVRRDKMLVRAINALAKLADFSLAETRQVVEGDSVAWGRLTAEAALAQSKPGRGAPLKLPLTNDKTDDVFIVAGLSKYHGYQDGQITNHDPIPGRRLAAMLDPKNHKRLNSTVGRFFQREFGSHRDYEILCRRNPVKLARKLQQLNGEVPEARGEGGRDDDE